MSDPTDSSDPAPPSSAAKCHETFEVATLAMQFLQHRLAGIKNPESSLTPILHDRLYADALKQARRLLEMAAVTDDPEVHIYQFFEPNQDPLSFQGIQKILESAGWNGPCAENTLKTYAFEIIEAAQEEIDKRMEEIDTIVGGYLGFPVELEATTDRIRRFLSKMIRTTRLNRMVVDPENLVEKCVHCLIEEAETRTNCGGASNFDLTNNFSAYSNFVKYVCDGLSYGQFMKGDTRPQSKNREASLETAIHFIDHEFLDNGAAGRRDSGFLQLKKLHAWIKAKKTISVTAKQHLKKSLEHLEKIPPDLKNANIEAGRASVLLKHDLARWKLKALRKTLPAKQLKTLLALLQNSKEDGAFDPIQLEILESFANAPLPAPDIPPSNPPERTTPFDYTQYLVTVQGALEGCRNWIENSNPGREAEKLIEPIENIATTVANEISAQATSAAEHSRRLSRLLDEINEVREIRKVRPYELFLFAHQQGVLQEELTVKRSKLKPKILPGPEWPYHFSILSGHGGAPNGDVG